MTEQFIAVVPAAGVGARMGASIPKQYLMLQGKTVIEHTLTVLLSHPRIAKVVVALGPEDGWFSDIAIAKDPAIIRVNGGKERADSVLAGLQACQSYNWVLVHDAARPCLTHTDVDCLITGALASEYGAILGCQVRDTMKRTDANGNIIATVERDLLWHALTPQMFPVKLLTDALTAGLADNANITDEASAIELLGLMPKIVVGRADNIKITRPEDMPLATLYLQQSVKNK
ncbi:2-C-methyl-D-erythritol 4-phosphate cytidylyltransferase-4-diphosphocytidyl-2C-methyl-D-erythritol synthase-MEP cytidylyltransferase [Moritella viscosa]|uniref:2-C-methyl-D-erythritol 4-phosphate cytidylyltransferase n=1 Tax=Moritella viscosa TaxID=80854 RepID=UPI000913EED1|nr:2-C-methyl-D-erythritol 4-phosphate cytidylyltransferase [Moritella viscosa]SGY82173.1 2-C-methyl-D-erythritol 4-phosphate cytidylyltransferase-4-diphosphocytidyl-2C-methyl-D-erythritol synthase-MEP cytidylyltransferase [Moritella viscosa]